jgi:general secretion pathway protein G
MAIRYFKKGFTLIELLVVIAIIGILSAIVLAALSRGRDRAYEARARSEMTSIRNALELYYLDHGSYPADSYRDAPPGLENYLAGKVWPSAPWPNSFYDWDNWVDPATGKAIYQISVRFCPIGGPLSACNFPKSSWATNFDIDSSFYYCVEGACRSHINHPIDYPGYCVNCN